MDPLAREVLCMCSHAKLRGTQSSAIETELQRPKETYHSDTLPNLVSLYLVPLIAEHVWIGGKGIIVCMASNWEINALDIGSRCQPYLHLSS